jgi:protein TonB
MSYQALLFCPDEKTARTVTQVLSELDFAVTPCTEPFAAVKKLMGEHFDAVVVDCDNEQNATLLFKSARNSPNNQSALAVAVVEAQAGVAKAFRIGANLVLTKPINVEQAKGTLRVARGLLRKGEGLKPRATAATPAAKPAEPNTPLVKAAVVSGPGPATAAPKPASQPAAMASVAKETPAASKSALEAHAESKPAPVAKTAVQNSTSTTQSQPPAAWVGSNAASAPAPAREAEMVEPAPSASKTADSEPSESKAPEPRFSEPRFSEPKPDASSDTKPASTLEPSIPVETAAASEVIAPAEATAMPMPTLTFGGNASAETASTGAGSKKAWIGVAAVVLLAAAGYFGWTQWKQMGHASGSTPPAPVAAPSAKSVTPAAPRVVPENAAPAAPSVAAPAQGSTADAAPASQPVESNAVSHAAKSSTKTEPASTPTVAVAVNKAPETKQPMVIRNGAIKNDVSSSVADASAASTVAPLSALAINPTANSESLPKLPGASNAPTPVLGTVISQGISQELLIKKIPPVYPPNALRIRLEGTVQLQATISKKGDVSSVKVVKGNDLLAHAAVEAVKQWKYKPYVLDGAPVESQTQITIDFKLPK